MTRCALEVIEVPPARPQETLRHAVEEGLLYGPVKTLPCRFFYDELGSLLFERICQVPEYYPTRTERSILERHADAMIAAAAGDAAELSMVELGSGSSCKTRLLIEAALRRQTRLHYVPIDISRVFLRASAEVLRADYPCLSVTAIAAEYRDALTALPSEDTGRPRLFLFLGSNIGNFDPCEAISLLAALRGQMRPQDRAVVGADLVKDPAVLTAAYNDASGVTAAFNKNLLARINRELGADFDLDCWEHRAPWVPERSRIEMWLISRERQTVTVGALGQSISFEAGEGIHTENSHKFTPDAFSAVCAAANLTVEQVWTDSKEWFAVTLLRPLGLETDGAV
jgi:L-histidine N-alpha-methyltransferase